MKKKNIEEIRAKNLKENQLFLEKLKINNIRNDLVKSTRVIQPKKKAPILHEKIDRVTRYSLKVKSGEIVPQSQRIKRKYEPSKWTLLYLNNPNPYKRIFKPRKRD